MPKREANAFERHDDHGGERREREAERRHDLRPPGPAEAERRPNAAREQRGERVATTQPRPVVAPVADVVDAAGRRGRGRGRGHRGVAAGRHARTPGTGSAVATSSRARRRGTGPPGSAGHAPAGPAAGPGPPPCRGRCRTAPLRRARSGPSGPSGRIRRGSAGRGPRGAAASASRPSSTSTRQDPGLGGELGHRRRTEEAPAVDRHEVVADRLDLAQQVAGQDDRDPELGPGPPDELEHLVATRRVEPVRGLVEEEQPRVVDDRLRQLDPLAHPRGVAADRPVALLGEPHVTEDVRRALPGGLGRQAGQLASLGHELGGADVRRERGMLGHVAHVAPEPGPLRPRARSP